MDNVPLPKFLTQYIVLLGRFKILLQGKSEAIVEWVYEEQYHWLILCVCTIALCGGMYGLTIGLWRSPLQGVFIGIKFPLLIFLTVLGNSLINWMLSQALGLIISLKQSLIIILMSFTMAALILCSLSPVSLFVLYNIPSSSSEYRILAVSIITIMHVILIAIAGIISNIRLYNLLVHLSNRTLAKRIVCSWLLINLFLGAQLSWNLRPFIGSPALEVQFIRPNAFEGNFYEDVYIKIRRIIKGG